MVDEDFETCQLPEHHSGIDWVVHQDGLDMIVVASWLQLMQHEVDWKITCPHLQVFFTCTKLGCSGAFLRPSTCTVRTYLCFLFPGMRRGKAFSTGFSSFRCYRRRRHPWICCLFFCCNCWWLSGRLIEKKLVGFSVFIKFCVETIVNIVKYLVL